MIYEHGGPRRCLFRFPLVFDNMTTSGYDSAGKPEHGNLGGQQEIAGIIAVARMDSGPGKIWR
jgi:hypothetical protein